MRKCLVEDGSLTCLHSLVSSSFEDLTKIIMNEWKHRRPIGTSWSGEAHSRDYNKSLKEKTTDREEVTDKSRQRELQEDGRQGLWVATWDSAEGHQGWDEDGVENKRTG